MSELDERAKRVLEWVDGGGSSWGTPMQDIEALAKDRQNDLRRLLSALGMNTDARSQSPASVFDECLAEIRRIRA